ncbi:beta-lactamase family protein [Rhodococcus sp. D2-41]|uniref:Beta-lactamase family protein n=2 Tax=Speluncibacter jeojiensis TaxID=2710754 RepID=A0A9X4M4G6_9ACTN|nr:serine hydrolase domain-containing protein [Rhodococcus sp. D2-41]MDG3010532.1 beta-lactamase family protein [Rhodococcus sp. D2-41]MDG3014281.1 beta-lactamase family protein [Corynebacteriales bacterium D3-21]
MTNGRGYRNRRVTGVGLAAAAAVLAAALTPPAAAATLPQPNAVSVTGDRNEQTAVEKVAATIVGPVAPGMAVAIVKRDPRSGEPITTTYYFGQADNATPGTVGQVGPQTQFELASETKLFTGALLAKRVHDGQSQLTDHAQKYETGLTFPVKDGKNITLGELVTHRSGLTDDPPNDYVNRKAQYNRADLWQGLENPKALATSPGSTWLYSDFGFGTLGTLMADAFEPGQPQPPFADVVQRELTGLLGMPSTVLENQATNLAQPYGPDGTPAPLWDNIAAMAGGGGLVSTAADMATWNATTLGYGNSPLKPVLQSMLDTIPGVGQKMGMAWQLYPAQNGIRHPYAFKDGDSTGSSNATYLIPSDGFAVTVLTNGGHGSDSDSRAPKAVNQAAFDLMQELQPGVPTTGSSTGSPTFGS